MSLIFQIDHVLESAQSEVLVLKEVINGLKAQTSPGKNGIENGSGNNGADGWDDIDDVITEEDSSEANYESICDIARLKVDLQKAQSACEQLTEQLMKAESVKEQFEAEAKAAQEELDIARKAKEMALEEKSEMTQKHQVLSAYFNQREAELQKQLGKTFWKFYIHALMKSFIWF